MIRASVDLTGKRSAMDMEHGTWEMCIASGVLIRSSILGPKRKEVQY
jgi:hypothetical protein